MSEPPASTFEPTPQTSRCWTAGARRSGASSSRSASGSGNRPRTHSEHRPRNGLVRRLRVTLDVAAHLARLVRCAETADEMQCHVDAGRDSGGGDDVSVVDEALVRPRFDVTAERQQLVERAPVRRCRLPVEQTGVGVDKRAGADAGHQRATLLECAQPCPDRLVAELCPGAAAAGIDEDVDITELVPARPGEHAHALGARDRLAVLADEHDVDVVGIEEAPGRQYLPRPREVELLSTVEDSNGDPHLAATVAASADTVDQLHLSSLFTVSRASGVGRILSLPGTY